MMAHKLWAKACEPDWRTSIKAIYILHTVARECSKNSWEKFSKSLKYSGMREYYFVDTLI
jgi:hypothetical protein